MRDQQHAAKLFNVDQFRLAPKSAFLFHVSFAINTAALKSTDLVQKYGQEINMLVKSCDLPGFRIKNEILNQYNRKKVVQYGHDFNEIGMKFHDDNMNLVNQLWQNYYSYYFADSTSAKNQGAYARNATKNGNFITTPYGFDNSSTRPFFTSITIYQMARHEYASYRLINPIVIAWSHNRVDYAGTQPKDLDMKLQYEAVVYGQGLVRNGIPEGFGNSHYDLYPSPLVGPNPDPAVSMPSFATGIDTGALAPGILDNALQTAQNYENNSNNGTPNSAILNTIGGIGLGVAAFSAGSQLIGSLGGISGIASGIGNVIGSVASGIGDAVSGVVDAVFPGGIPNPFADPAAEQIKADAALLKEVDPDNLFNNPDPYGGDNLSAAASGFGTSNDLNDFYG